MTTSEYEERFRSPIPSLHQTFTRVARKVQPGLTAAPIFNGLLRA
jgi:hypothetical protein